MENGQNATIHRRHSSSTNRIEDDNNDELRIVDAIEGLSTAEAYPGRYRMFSQNGFRSSLVTKLWTFSVFVGSCALILASDTFLLNNFLCPSNTFRVWDNFIKFHSVRNYILSKFFFTRSSISITFGITLIYYMRFIERRFGTRKFLRFLLTTGLTSSAIELAIYYLFGEKYIQDENGFFATGPFALIGACFLQFLVDIPYVPYAKISFLPLSMKNLPCFFFIQLCFVSRPSLAALLSGLLAGILYRCNVLYQQNWSFLPKFLRQIFAKSSRNPIRGFFEFVENLGEDLNGRILPVAATIDRQRTEFLDDYERRLMLRQMRHVYQADQLSRPNDEQLRHLSRLYGNSASSSEPSEQLIGQVMDMGFGDRDAVRQTLIACANDVNSAVNSLLRHRSSENGY